MTMTIMTNPPEIETAHLFDEDGTLLPQPAAYWSEMPREYRQIVGHKHALYSFPTIENIALLKGMLPNGTLEIGAGNGGYCKALEIRGTDSFQQQEPNMQKYYEAHGQPVISYGAHVEKLDAKTAVRKYLPRAVLAAWVTHKWNQRWPDAGGNMWGVDEHWMLDRIEQYFFIGNSGTHEKKPLFKDLLNGRITSHTIDVMPLADCSRAAGGTDFLLVATRRREW